MSEILPNLYIGNMQDATNMIDVDFVINCTSTLPFYSPTARGIRIKIEDNGNPEEFEKLYDYVQNSNLFHLMDLCLEEKKTILVHCMGGFQRSCSLVACYLIYKLQLNPTQAIEFIRQKRPIAFFGNVNFLHAIQKYYNSLTCRPQ